jgi:hypothetical protein
MRVTNRIEIHRRRLKWRKLIEKGMKVKDLAILYDVNQTTISLGVKRINELLEIYGSAVLDESWAYRATFKPQSKGMFI